MKNLALKVTPLLILFALVSCNQQSEGTNAEVSEAKEVQDVASSSNYEVDVTSTVVTWIGSKPTGKHNGTIPVSAGKIAVEGNEIVGGTIDLNIASITNIDLADDSVKQGQLISHLKSNDFFDADNFPQANFTITAVEAYTTPENMEVKEEYDTEFKPANEAEFMVASPTHKITGNLTMRGKTLSISFPAKVTMEDGMIKGKAKFNIDRTMWGLMYGDEASAVDKAKDKFIYNTVNVGLELVAKAESM